MMNHKYWLDCGLPDLAESAKQFLENSDQYEVDDLEVTPDQVAEVFAKQMRTQLFEGPRTRHPGLSQTGACRRKQVYQGLGYTGESVTGGAKTTFTLGDTTEWWLLSAAINAGWHIEQTVFDEDGQLEVQLPEVDTARLGHPDGIIDLADTIVVVEIKSMKEWKYGFWLDKPHYWINQVDEEAVFEVDPEDDECWSYWDRNLMQMHGYMRALQEEYTDKKVCCLFWALNKNSGWHRCAKVEFSEKIWQLAKERIAQVKERIDGQSLPPRHQKCKEALANGAKSIGFPASYCRFYKECLGENCTRETHKDTGKQTVTLHD